MGELRQLIRLAADEAGGYRSLARRSRGAVSAATLNNLVTGRHTGNLKDAQLSGVAMAVGRPAREIADMIGRAYADPAQPFVLPERANALSRQQRKVVLSVVDAILSAGQVVPATSSGAVVRDIRPVAKSSRGSAARAADASPNTGRARRRELDRQAETPPPIPEESP